jgi:hypothetical protein
LEAENVEKEIDVAREVLVPVHAALAESVVSGEVGFLPKATAFVMVAAASAAASSSGRGAGGAIASAAAESETTTWGTAHGQKRAGVAVWSAAVKTTRAVVAVKVARAFAGEGSAHVASAVDRGMLNLTGRVVARASHFGSARWATIAGPLFSSGHAAQNKQKVNVRQGSRIL